VQLIGRFILGGAGTMSIVGRLGSFVGPDPPLATGPELPSRSPDSLQELARVNNGFVSLSQPYCLAGVRGHYASHDYR